MGHFAKQGDPSLSRSFTKEMEELFAEDKFVKAKVKLSPEKVISEEDESSDKEEEKEYKQKP